MKVPEWLWTALLKALIWAVGVVLVLLAWAGAILSAGEQDFPRW